MKVSGPYDRNGHPITVEPPQQSSQKDKLNNAYEDLSPADRIKLLKQNYRELKMEEARKAYQAKMQSLQHPQVKHDVKQAPLRFAMPKTDDKSIMLTTLPGTNSEANSKLKTLSIRLPINVSLATVLKNIYEHMYEYYFHKRPLLDSRKEDMAAKRVIAGLISRDMENISRIVKTDKSSADDTSIKTWALQKTPSQADASYDFRTTQQNYNSVTHAENEAYSVKEGLAPQHTTYSPASFIQPNTIVTPAKLAPDQVFNFMNMNPRRLKSWYYKKLYRDRMNALNEENENYAFRRTQPIVNPGWTRNPKFNQVKNGYFTTVTPNRFLSNGQRYWAGFPTSTNMGRWNHLQQDATQAAFRGTINLPPGSAKTNQQILPPVTTTYDQKPLPQVTPEIDSLERQIYDKILQKHRVSSNQNTEQGVQPLSQVLIPQPQVQLPPPPPPPPPPPVTSQVPPQVPQKHQMPQYYTNSNIPSILSKKLQEPQTSSHVPFASTNKVGTIHSTIRTIPNKIGSTQNGVGTQLASFAQQKDLFDRLTSRNFEQASKQYINKNIEVVEDTTYKQALPQTDNASARSKLQHANNTQKRNYGVSGPLESYLQTLEFLKKENRLHEAEELASNILQTPLSVIAEEHKKRKSAAASTRGIKGPSLFKIVDSVVATKNQSLSTPRNDVRHAISQNTGVHNSSQRVLSDTAMVGAKAMEAPPSNLFLIDTTGVADNKPMVIESVQEYMQKEAKKKKKTTQVANAIPTAFSGIKRKIGSSVVNASMEKHSPLNVNKTTFDTSSIKTVYIAPLRHRTPSGKIYEPDQIQTGSLISSKSQKVGQTPTLTIDSTATGSLTPQVGALLGKHASPVYSPMMSKNMKASLFNKLNGVPNHPIFSTSNVKDLPRSAFAKGSIYTYNEEMEEASRPVNKYPAIQPPVDDPEWDKKHTIGYDTEIISKKNYIPERKFFNNDHVLLMRHHHLRRRMKLMKRDGEKQEQTARTKRNAKGKEHLKGKVKALLKNYEKSHSVSQVKLFLTALQKKFNITGKNEEKSVISAPTNQRNQTVQKDALYTKDVPMKSLLALHKNKTIFHAENAKTEKHQKSSKKKEKTKRKLPRRNKTSTKKEKISETEASKKSDIEFDHFEFQVVKPIQGIFNDDDMANHNEKSGDVNLGQEETFTKTMEKYKKSKIPSPPRG